MKAVAAYITLTSAVILLLLHFTGSKNKQVNNSSNNNADPYGRNRRLGYKIPPPFFDPLEDNSFDQDYSTPSQDGLTTENSNVKSEKLDDEHAFNEGKLNATSRLMALFPYLEREPKDGMIDLKELEAWIVRQTIRQLHLNTQKQLKFYDKNGDNEVSFSEYLPQFSNEDIERNEMEHGQAGWWKEQFDNADADQNGSLNFYEFRDFLHPEDSKNEMIHKWLIRKKIRQIDRDKDQKVNFLEFRRRIYEGYRKYVEFETFGAYAGPPKEIFGKLDTNDDGLLEVEELKPLIRYLCPGEIAHAKYYANHLIREADEDGDGKLTLDEMLHHDYLFYNTLYEEYEILHDEL